jgi:hypothetical protein
MRRIWAKRFGIESSVGMLEWWRVTVAQKMCTTKVSGSSGAVLLNSDLPFLFHLHQLLSRRLRVATTCRDGNPSHGVIKRRREGTHLGVMQATTES